MTNEEAAEAVLQRLPEADREGWRATLIRTLARALDDNPQAATANQYRLAMNELSAEVRPAERSPLDELADRRASRIAAAEAGVTAGT